MSDRIIQQSLLSDSRFDELGWFPEVAYQRLALIADDDGCVPMDVDILRRVAFPRKKAVTNKAIKDAVSALVEAGLLIRCTNPRDGSDTLVFSDDRMFRRFFTEAEISEKDNNIIINTNNNNNSVLRYNASLEGQHVSNDREHNSNLERNTERGNTTIPERNPYGTNDGVSTNIADMRTRMTRGDTVQAYVTNNLSYMSPGQLQVLQTYIDEMPEELIRLAVDKACDGGFSRRTWRYTKAILDNWLDEGYKTVADVLAADEARRAKKKAKKTDDYSDPDDLSWW